MTPAADSADDIPPPGAWDCHCHIFGPIDRFPYAASRAFTPPEAPKEQLFAMHEALGIGRAVIVQSGVHGRDHAAAIDALRAKKGAYRGVALLSPDASDADIRALSREGFCGVRFNFMAHLGASTPINDVMRLADRLAAHEWHLQVHFDPALLVDLAPALRRARVPVVIDHMGRLDAGLGLDQPVMRDLLRLLEDERFWVKVSGSERVSRSGPPYDDAIPFARAFMRHCGDRVLWGTDWPHPNVPEPRPDDLHLLKLVARVAPTAAERRALLVDNPTRLYGGAA